MVYVRARRLFFVALFSLCTYHTAPLYPIYAYDTSLYDHITTMRKNIRANSTPRPLESSVFNYLFAHDPIYAQDFADRLNSIIAVFYDLVSNNVFKQTNACLLLPHLSIEEPYHHMLEKVINELIPLYFDTDGTLLYINSTNSTARNFIIAQFLKNGIDNEYYKKLLDIFNFQEVIAHENQTSTYLVNNLYHVATGGWLPSLTWYPATIKTLIKDNPENHLIATVLDHCCTHNFAPAYNIVLSHDNPITHQVYRESYQAFKEDYCNDYGILKAYEQDPLWEQKTDYEKQAYRDTLQELCNFNQILYTRAQQKTQLHEAWNISYDAPLCIHNALYDLIDVLETGTHFIAKATEIIAKHTDPERSALIEALFMPHGILKHLQHMPVAHAYQFPACMFDDMELVKKMNELVYIQHTYAGTEQGVLAQLHLTQLHTMYSTALEHEPPALEYDPEHMPDETLFKHIRSKIATLTCHVKRYTKATYNSLKRAIGFFVQIFG